MYRRTLKQTDLLTASAATEHIANLAGCYYYLTAGVCTNQDRCWFMWHALVTHWIMGLKILKKRYPQNADSSKYLL